MKVLLLLIISIIDTQANIGNCLTPIQKDCSFYESCIENSNECGETGYAIGYGKKYCEKFLNYNFTRRRGQVWVESALSCLQKSLIPIYMNPMSYTCQEIRESAFNAHPNCYLDPDKKNSSISVCWLPLIDLIQIFRVIDFQDLISRDAIRQERVVAKTCTKRIMLKWLTGRRVKTLELEDEYIERMNFFEDISNK